MDAVDAIVAQLYTWGNNFCRNLLHMWDDMTAQRYIRMVAVIGAYFFLRPYLVKIGERIQAKQHEKVLETPEEAPKTKITPNQLRGATGKEIEIAESEEEEEEEEGQATSADWGKKARKRQRQFVKKVLEEEEKKRREEQEDEEDKDIREYLVDYVEGEDGW